MSDTTEYKGARFYKCALQVNSSGEKQRLQGGNHQDEDTYNRQILEQCRKNKIKVVGLADHGSVSRSGTLRCCLTDNGITVFPGFEIASSEKIHMVCSYPETTDKDQLNGFLAQLMGKNVSELRNNPAHPSSLSCEEMAEMVLKKQNGFWYAAHITNNNGLLRLSGVGDNFLHLWKKDDLVVAAQIPGSIEDLYGGEDLTKYRKIIKNQDPNYEREKPIAVINAKDVYEPNDLSHSSASCLVKMTRATFQAFKDAFKDPQSRIFLNSSNGVPSTPVSVIESIRWSGSGLFEDQKLVFSNHLNAVIGGRGTGKSTFIESIRFALDLQPHGNDRQAMQGIQSSNLKNSKVTLKVRCGSQHGEYYTISRRFGESPVIKNANGEISQMTPQDLLPEIELLGQNEILKIEESKVDKLALLKKFLPDTLESDNRIAEAKRKLSENRIKIIAAQKGFDEIEQKVNRKEKLEEQKQQYKKLGIEEKLKNSALLEKEKQIESRVDDQLNRVADWLDQYSDIFDLGFLRDKNIEGLPNKESIAEIRSHLEKLETSLDGLYKHALEKLEATVQAHQSEQKVWKEKSDAIRDQINQAIAQLPDQGDKPGKEIGDNYRKIVADLSVIERHKEEFKRQKEIIKALESERLSLLEEYRDTAFQRCGAMERRSSELNKREFHGKIKISVLRCKNLETLEEFLKNLPGIGPAKIKWLDDIEGPIDLVSWAQWIKDGSRDKFIEQYKKLGMADSTVDRLMKIDLEQRMKLEEIELEDDVSISLNVAHEGEARENYVPIEKLSVGQKCTATLNLLLAKLGDPLIIDQPEDHLDNAFIAERIVSELRNLKTKRQFLFATHNANIPVFGDAELIVVLENKGSEKAVLKNKGSIDDPDIRDQAAQILEGGKAAFDMRKEKYGF